MIASSWKHLRLYAHNLAELELWVVAALALVSLVDQRWLLPCILAACPFWLLRWVGDGRLTARTAADWPIVILVTMLLLNLWWIGFPTVSLTQGYRLLCGVVLYYALVNWATSQRRLRLATLGLIAVGVLLSAYSLVQTDWQARSLAAWVRSYRQPLAALSADTINPNVIAGSLALILPLALAGVFSQWGRGSWLLRPFAGCASLLIGGVIGISLSRGAWIAAGLSVIALLLLRWRGRWLVLAVTLILIAFAIYRVGPAPLLDMLMGGTSVGDLLARLNVWSRAVIIIRDFPFTGVGLGMFQTAIAHLFPLSLAGAPPIEHAHNLYLQIAVDLGLPALIAWLSLLLLALRIAWQAFSAASWQRPSAVWIGAASAGLLGSVLALAAHGMVDAVTWGMVRPAPLVWVIWGLIMAYGNAAQQGLDG